MAKIGKLRVEYIPDSCVLTRQEHWSICDAGGSHFCVVTSARNKGPLLRAIVSAWNKGVPVAQKRTRVARKRSTDNRR